MKVILKDIDLDDFVLAMRAVKSFLKSDHQGVIYAYGEEGKTTDFYVCRNKASVTVRSISCSKAAA